MLRSWPTTRRRPSRRPNDGAEGQPRRGALRVGFPDDDVPLAVAIARLTAQKGADLLVPIVPILRSMPLRLVVLGSGEAEIAAHLSAAAAGQPDWFSFVDGYDDQFAHLLHGGADLLLMPSRFEPCGLTQMQAMRYGAIPVVTDVGGLHDTVVDVDYEAEGTGFRAPEATSVAFTSALFRASRHLSSARHRNAVIGRGMHRDWSWREPAATTSSCTNGSLLRRANFGVWPNRECSSSSWPAARASDSNHSPTIGPSRPCRSPAATA